VAALLLALFAANASATVFHVDAGSGDAPDQDLNDGMCDAAAGAAVTCTIRAAVQTANSLASPSADEIEIPAGPYAFSGALAGNDDTAALGDLDITNNLEIRGVGGNATINAAGLDRIFHIPSGVPTVTLSNLTLNGGNAASASHGGAIKAESGSLTIDHSSIFTSQALEGGSKGGGIYAAGGSSLKVTDSSIGGNQVAPGAVFGGFGGGIYSEVPLTMERSSVYSNVVAQGCTQIGCGGQGGGLYLTGGGTLTNVTVYNNLADGNSMGNAANAGGILAGGGVSLVNSTVANNSTTGGGGGLGGGNLVAGMVTLRNTIIANGSSNNPGYENCGIPDPGPYISEGNNLEARPGQGASQCGLTPGSNGDITSTDAGLGTFDFHGGPTQTVALMPLSPAVDAGGPNGPSIDQRGVARPQGSRCDIGAYERDSTPPGAGFTCAGPPSPPSSTPLLPTTAAPLPPRKKCKKGRKLKKGKCVRKKKPRP
jgi:hypothetical protein